MKPMTAVIFTHYGWFGFCPVLLGRKTNGILAMQPRWKLVPIMAASGVCTAIYINIRRNLNPNYNPEFLIRVTGKLNKPKKAICSVQREGGDE